MNGRYSFIAEHSKEFSVRRMAEIEKVSTSGYYDWLKREASPRMIENEKIYHDIEEIFLASRRAYGARRIAVELARIYGKPINRKRVQRLMNENGLAPKGRKKFVVTTDSSKTTTVFPNLLKRDFTAEARNMKMVSDTTYIYTKEGWLYLAAIMDLYGRKIVGMAVSKHNDEDLVIAALKDVQRRIGRKKLEGCILHSDRGSTYASKGYIELIKDLKMKGSMSRKGNCWDNAPIESFWGRMKVEWLEKVYETRQDATDDIYKYIWAHYNRFRLHSTNGYKTPEEIYSGKAAA